MNPFDLLRATDVSVGDIVDNVGADALRLKLLSSARPDNDIAWDWGEATGTLRYLRGLWDLALSVPMTDLTQNSTDVQASAAARQLGRGITEHFRTSRMHSAVADLRKLTRLARETKLSADLDLALLLLRPVVPHITAELWSRRKGDHIHDLPWPSATG
jgi:leucyl-tRNA synthetase